MSSRRVPLTSNPNVANSPLRGPGSLHAYAKQKRSYANVQREEAYGQPPPVKKQVLEDGTQRAVRSPSKAHRTQVVVQRSSTRLVAKDRATRTTQASTRTVQDVDTEKEVWKKHHRAKFPKMVFYFESIPDDIRAKLTKRVNYLGARQEPFFSIDITHVVTTRSIPPEKSGTQHEESLEQEQQEPEEQPQTINPSLLDRNTAAGRRKLLFDFRQTQIPSQQADDPTRRTKGTRNNDVLHKAREMGKKIWSLDKFQNMLAVLLESETRGATYAAGTTSVRSQYGVTKGSHEPNLLQLLHNERLNGPSDRDPTAVNRELVYFKGPYIYVWDMDDKYKPIMVREYAKAVNKQDGEWPQFRSVGNGRCPFVEEIEIPEKEQRRNLLSKQAELKSQNAFTSRAEGTRLFAGEPVASGMQPSNVTSAIRSQMISSTSGINGGKAGTSKEVHGLQRKVLQKANPASHDVSSRRFAEVSMDVASSRSTTMSRQTSKAVQPHDDESQRTECREKKSNSQFLKSKRDLKPGYCENCQDKFPDFDEHILSRKHRKFAENDDNWTELDLLLEQLKRMPKYAGAESDNDDNGW
ncbi:Hsk1-interacting molecule 1 [Metarhizium anisopliae]